MPLVQPINAVPAMDGAGVRIQRAIGTRQLPHPDPFLMLDYFDSARPDDYLAGFPAHPHRGFVTLTYMLQGRMRHRDSMNNEGVIDTGGAQWMQAASGVIHSEMPEQVDGRMAGFQLWINLPAAAKMSPPDYQEYRRDQLPQLVFQGGRATLVAGDHQGLSSPIRDPHTDVCYMNVKLGPGTAFELPGSSTRQGFLFDYRGCGKLYSAAGAEQGEFSSLQLLPIAPDHSSLRIRSGTHGLQALWVSGKPLGEPVVQAGPFVMNSRTEIDTAIRDYQQGILVQPHTS